MPQFHPPINRALIAALALFSLPFLWLLGTRFQDTYAPSTQRIYRCVACVFLLILLPGAVLTGSVVFASTGGYVQAQFDNLEENKSDSKCQTHN